MKLNDNRVLIAYGDNNECLNCLICSIVDNEITINENMLVDENAKVDIPTITKISNGKIAIACSTQVTSSSGASVYLKIITIKNNIIEVDETISFTLFSGSSIPISALGIKNSRIFIVYNNYKSNSYKTGTRNNQYRRYNRKNTIER